MNLLKVCYNKTAHAVLNKGFSIRAIKVFMYTLNIYVLRHQYRVI